MKRGGDDSYPLSAPGHMRNVAQLQRGLEMFGEILR